MFVFAILLLNITKKRGLKLSIYFDNAATTKPVKTILEKIKPYLECKFYNPSALYSDARRIRNDIENVRSLVAKEINAKPEEIFFTSGATESNNWVIQGFANYHYNNKPTVITTNIEHDSINKAIEGNRVYDNAIYIPVDSEGFIYLDLIEKMLKLQNDKSNKVLVTVCFGNNEIGTIQKIKEISDIVHKYNAVLHTDATQVFGHVKIDVEELKIDYLSASAQKINGLKGIGFLYKRNSDRTNIAPLIYGSQEGGLRGGTENVIGIIALGEAIMNIDYKESKSIVAYRDKLISNLEKLGCKLNGSRYYRLPNNINITLPDNISGEALIYMLDVNGIQISSGSACNSHSTTISKVLSAIGLNNDDVMSTVRITLPRTSEFNIPIAEQIEQFYEEFKKSITILSAG